MAIRYYWTGSGVTQRANSTPYSAGARIVIALADVAGNFAVARRFVWECTTGGTSGAAVPTWPASVTADTTTLTDGTVTWTARNPGYSSGTTENWNFATIFFLYAVAAANASGDFIYAHYTSQEEVTSDTTFSITNDLNIISVNKDSSNAPTAMGTGGWIGNSTTNRNIVLSGGFKVFLNGVTFRIAGSTADSLVIASGGSAANIDGAHYELENCYLWQGNTNSSASIIFGINTLANSYVRLINSTIRFGNTGQSVQLRMASVVFEGCVISTSGSAPSTLLTATDGGAIASLISCDLSHVTGTLVGSMSTVARSFIFSQCKLGSGVTPLATQTPANKSSGVAYLFDCASDDTHTFMGYYDAFGSCVSDSTIYYTTGAAAQSWKIVTTANCSYYTPFVSPFVDFYNTGTTSITPRFEILRDGSTTAFQNDEVWGEFFVKTTSGSTQSTEYSDRMALLGSPVNQDAGAGTGSWTGEAASAWSGKVDSGSAVTPAEVGAIRGRVVVGEPSITVYVDPQIRT